MKLTDVSINRSMTVFTLMALVIILGATSYIRLPREASPDVEIPFVFVSAPYFGASPGDMETLVTRKLENQLKGIPFLEEMSSSSNEGITMIFLEFSTDVEMSDALQNVRDAVETAKPDLPGDVRDDLIIREISSDDWPVMQVVLSGDFGLVALKEAGEDLQEEFERINGVLSIDLSGGVEKEVLVDVDPVRLARFGFGSQDVFDAIAFENINLPGGELTLGAYEYQVRTPGEFESIDEIRDVLLNPGAPSPVYIRDVAEVSFDLAERESFSRLDGSDSVTLTVKKRSGENIIRIADEVRAAIDRLQPRLPAGTNISITGDMSVFIEDIVSELENNILSGLILVVIVIFLFLGVRNSLFIAAAIPFSMLITFIILRALDITLNMIVLFSLILALGMLVDNAIVIVENIYRHRVRGAGKAEAAGVATDQVSAAVIASTLTTVCAFLPLIFWPGIMGDFMSYLPITVIIVLVASLFVALVFNPVLCANFMTVPDATRRDMRPGDRLLDAGLRLYEPVLRAALRFRFLTVAAMFLLLLTVGALFARFNTGVELFPDTDPTMATVSIEAPSGTRIELTDSYARAIEEPVMALPDLKAVVSAAGSGGGGGGLAPGVGSSHLASVNFEFFEHEKRSSSTVESISRLREALTGFTGARLSIDKQEMGPPTGKPINIEISGDDFSVLGNLAGSIQEKIRDIPGLVDLRDDYDTGRPEILVDPSPEKAARLGIRTSDVARLIRTAVHGTEVSTFRIGEDEFDIIVRFASGSGGAVEDLEDLTVFTEGKHVPLTAFSSVSFGTGYGTITRIDSRRVVTVSADAASGCNGSALLDEVRTRLARFPLPPGYFLAFTGENEDAEEAGTFLSEAFRIVLLLILLVLITQFTSITIPVVIMVSVILSLTGVFLGLLVTGTPFGIIMTGVGVISLAGVVVNNAIVLLDYVIRLRNRGIDKIEAIVQAGRTRFRPVLLTAITTILGLVPLTTGLSLNFDNLAAGDFGHVLVIGGESSQWWGPMGTAVIWGLAVATFLTLVVVPVMYASIDPVKRAAKTVFIDLPVRPFRNRR